jgi:hypothetical protein
MSTAEAQRYVLERLPWGHSCVPSRFLPLQSATDNTRAIHTAIDATMINPTASDPSRPRLRSRSSGLGSETPRASHNPTKRARVTAATITVWAKTFTPWILALTGVA